MNRINPDNFNALKKYNKRRYTGEFSESQPCSDAFLRGLESKKNSPIYLILDYANENDMKYEDAVRQADSSGLPIDTLTTAGIKISVKLLEIKESMSSKPRAKEQISILWVFMKEYRTSTRRKLLPAIENVCQECNLQPQEVPKLRRMYGVDDSDEEDEENDEN